MICEGGICVVICEVGMYEVGMCEVCCVLVVET